jgi:hypothetical protein
MVSDLGVWEWESARVDPLIKPLVILLQPGAGLMQRFQVRKVYRLLHSLSPLSFSCLAVLFINRLRIYCNIFKIMADATISK